MFSQASGGGGGGKIGATTGGGTTTSNWIGGLSPVHQQVPAVVRIRRKFVVPEAGDNPGYMVRNGRLMGTPRSRIVPVSEARTPFPVQDTDVICSRPDPTKAVRLLPAIKLTSGRAARTSMLV